MTQLEKALVFQALHRRDRAFVIPNPWDAGSAQMLAKLGFEALATTSAGAAFASGHLDYGVQREIMLAHIQAIAAATDLPVSADLENGYGDSPEQASATIRDAAACGIVGGSIEDYSGAGIYDFDLAVERVRASVEAARALPFPFTLTARCENYLHERPDLQDTIRRLQAYHEAGADVLYAPGLQTREQIAEVVRSVDRPVNVVVGLRGMRLSLAELSELGVRRISLGSALYRTAIGAFLRGSREIVEHGTFDFTESAATSREISDLLR